MFIYNVLKHFWKVVMYGKPNLHPIRLVLGALVISKKEETTKHSGFFFFFIFEYV